MIVFPVSSAQSLKRNIRACVTGASLCIGALLVLSSCSGGAPAGPTRGPAPVKAAAAITKDVPIKIRAIGTVEASSEISVKSLVGGTLTRVAFREGQDVKKGAVLFEIDPRPYQAALAEAEAALARDEAKLRSARDDVRRYADLVKKDYVTEQQFTQVQAEADALEATVKADKAAIENARLNLGYCTVRAPIDGRTGDILLHQGNVIKANDAAVLTLRQMSPIYVDFSLPEGDLSEIRDRFAEGGLEVEAVLPDRPGTLYRGTLSFIDNAVSRDTGMILLKATFENADRSLWPGQFVNLSLILRTETGVVVVPSQAVQRGQEGDFLFVLKSDMTVDLRKVTVGQQYDGEIVIQEGVTAGERVVTDGQLRLYPGAKVSIVTDSPAAQKVDA